MTAASPRIAVLFALLFAACSKGSDGGGVDAPFVAKPFAWVDNVQTQPLPAWASTTRLQLPVPLDSIILGPGGGLGAYGAHEGGHVEGLDHIWILIKPGTVVRSWADGTVSKIEDMGQGQLYISIDYGDGLIGKHMEAFHSFVSVGQKVKAGDAIDTGSSAEFMLIDNNRSDGERTNPGGGPGSFVSPYDYLRPDVLASLLAKQTNEVISPWFSQGLSAGNHRPWEPMFTNKMFFHPDHRGTIVGEWILMNKGWTHIDPLYYDVMTVHDVTNSFGHFLRAEFEDHDPSLAGYKTGDDASYQLGDAPGKIIITTVHFGTLYGLYTIDESGGRAHLTLELAKGGYPAAITANAAVYIERAPTYLSADAQALGLIK